MTLLTANLQITSTGTDEPVTLAEFKRQLRIPLTDVSDDTHLADILKSARRMVELDARRSFINKTIKLYLDEFPTGDGDIPLAYPPARGITSISYTNSTGGTSTVSTSVYELDSNNLPGYIRLQYDQTWPTSRKIQNAITITFTAGTTTSTGVDPVAKHAIKVKATDLYCNRGSQGAPNTMAYEELIGCLRWGSYPK